MKVYTTRIQAKENSIEHVIDITVKTGLQTFAPTWEMVIGLKKGKISWKQYKELYLEKMRDSYRKHRPTWERLLKRDKVVLACYCAKPDQCHRSILADILVKLGAEYGGEI